MNKVLPLRTGVGIILLNSKNKIFVAKRKDNPIDKWQMPQGGVDPGESLLTAMKRELKEETNVSSIKVLKELDYWLEYELPKHLLGIIWKGKYRGQKQKEGTLLFGVNNILFTCLGPRFLLRHGASETEITHFSACAKDLQLDCGPGDHLRCLLRRMAMPFENVSSLFL